MALQLPRRVDELRATLGLGNPKRTGATNAPRLGASPAQLRPGGGTSRVPR